MADFSLTLAGKPHFFRIILDTNNRLMIPLAFSKKHYSNPTTTPTATLTVPSGLSWEVQLHKTLTRQDGQPEFWIQGQVWEHFARYHRLQKGHFILFQYEGDSRFSLFVFAISGCEVLYPSMEENPAQAHGDGVSVEILADSDSPKKQNGQTEKNRGGFLDPKAEDGDDDISVEILSDSAVGPSRRKQSRGKTKSRLNLNPSFSVVVRETYLNGYRLFIKKEFAMEYLKFKEQTVKLQLADSTNNNKKKKQQWFVEAVKVKGRDEMYLAKGDLLKFFKDSRFEVGDVCKFELMDVDEVLLVLQVSISRSVKM
ncbi:Putative B3 domain-containing protein Os03g0621600 [Linum grandiflorum]